MAWTDDEWIPISALQHFTYCERQCALIHLDQTFDENIYTLRGRRAHERVDAGVSDSRDGVRSERSVPLWSIRLGIHGKADVVEFGPDGVPFPVEHKAGAKKARLADEVQLCAQALCLEEMMTKPIRLGAIFHAASKRRREVVLTDDLRKTTEDTVARVRRLFASTVLPPPVADARCEKCSLIDACMPFAVQAWPAHLKGFYHDS